MPAIDAIRTGGRSRAYTTKKGTAPSARCTWPESGIDASAAAETTTHTPCVPVSRERSNAYSASGSSIETGAIRWPIAPCVTRYGASAKASPPASAPAGSSRSSRSQRKREGARADERQEHERVPGEHGPEQGEKRPEDDPERPAGEVGPRLDLGLEAVRVEPWRCATFDLVARQPQLPERLQVIARRRLPAGGQALGEEAVVGLAQRRPGRGDPGKQVDAEDERYNACAAPTIGSRSGTSASS